jgi:pyrophosphatase PpaX
MLTPEKNPRLPSCQTVFAGYTNIFMKKNIFPVRIRAVLFDLDGVLVDSFRYWFYLFNQALRHFGHEPINLRTFRKSWGQSTAEDVRIFMPEKTVDEVRAYFLRRKDDHIRFFRVDPRAAPVLRELCRRGIRIGCVTNSHRPITRVELKTTGLKGFFKVVMTADDVENPKPDPEMLLAACRRLRVAPAAAIFIGDTMTDRQAGQAAGCPFVGFRLVSRVSIDRLDDLPALIAGIG